QEKAIDTFYALLVHTSSTHGGFEWSITPWGNRDYGNNLAPHGCFAGKFLLFYRNMFVREQGRTLHLASALSPAWFQPGKVISFRNGPTAFGKISYEMHIKDNGAEITIQPPERDIFDVMILHFPPHLRVTAVSADGKSQDVKDNAAAVPPGTKIVSVKWEKIGSPDINYETAVKKYLEEYSRRKKSQE
ncbi:MAG: hypothetical protein AB1546_07460, partial [bacterium]